VAMRPPMGPPTLTRRTRILLIVAGVLVLLVLGGNQLINMYIDWLWFGEVNFRGVFSTVLFTQIVQFLAGGLLMGGMVALSLWIAYRSRPVFVPVSGPEDPIARYRTVIIQRLRMFAIGIPGIVGLIAAFAALGDWQIVQAFLNSTPFGQTDAVFNIDLSFYTFELPFYRYLLNWLFVAVAIGFVAALVTHYIFGGIRLAGRSGQVSAAARTQLAIMAGVFVLLKAVAYALDRYDLLSSDRKSKIFFGATYTDLNAVMPAKLILLIISVICAIAFFSAVFRRNLQLPAIATVLLILSSILIGAAWPAVLEQFVVAPNAQDRESASIQRNIDATKAAFGIGDDKVEKEQFTGVSQVPDAQIRNDTATVPNIRLLDPAKLSDTFQQLQEQNRKFYGFADKLDIDRYSVNNKLQDYIVGVRELKSSELTGNQTDWINRRLVYTHGDGLVVAPANKVGSLLTDNNGAGGTPILTSIDLAHHDASGNIPPSLQTDQTRIYYGELIDGYSIVGGTTSRPLEYDADSQYYSYTGSGGVPIGSLFNRLVFALHYSERNILFNSSINADSKIMYNRSPVERVEKVAPWLTTDSDPYPAVVDGKIVWIVDGYTTLQNYPYSESVPLGAATADAQQSLAPHPIADQSVNYLRNSVKATVDAFDGTVKLYAFDETDPVLKTWEKAFPGTVLPKSQISPDLNAHFRYPEDQFKVQRDLLTRYHVESPTDFYSGVSFWDVPSDPTVQSASSAANSAQPPYYVLAGQPGNPAINQSAPTFQLTSSLVFRGRENLAAYMSVSSDPGSYGKFTVLQLPPDTQTAGPQQVQTRFLGTPAVTTDLTFFRNGASAVDFGNLLTLPIGGGLMYVEPLYIERTNQSVSYAQLARVLVFYNNRIGYDAGPTKALDQAFGVNGSTPTPTTPSTGGTTAPTTGGTGGALTPSAAQAANAVAKAFNDFKAAQRANDYEAQSKALAALDAAVQQYQQASGQSTPAPAGPGN
jgi:uncharacterized protein